MADENENEEFETVGISPEDLKNLRNKAREADRLQAEHAAAQRELAFAKAKLDLDDPKMTYFVKGYEGELTSDAIRQAAEEAGFLQPAAPQQPQVPAQELAQHQQLGAASAGGTAPPPQDFYQLLSEAKTPEDVMRIASQAGLPTVWNRPS